MHISIHIEETDHFPTTNQKKDLTIDQLSNFVADGSHDDKKRQKRHKRKSKRKQLEKVIAPPPLRPRSRPTSQQSGTRSEGVSSVGGVAEGINASKLNEKQDTQVVKISMDSKEDTKASDSINNSIGQHDIPHDNEQITIVEETPAEHVTIVEETPAEHVTIVEETPAEQVTIVEETPAEHVTIVEETPAEHVTIVEDKVHTPNKGDINSDPIDNDKETEATAE